MDSLTPEDATRYWLARRTRNDVFLLYCFEDTGVPTVELRAAVAARSALIADLRIRIRERRFAYPAWVGCGFSGDQVVEHSPDVADWSNVVAALGDMLSVGLRSDEYPWCLHLFRAVAGAPGGDAPALVAVLQVSHALADGQRSAAIARALFTEPETSGTVDGSRVGKVRNAGVLPADVGVSGRVGESLGGDVENAHRDEGRSGVHLRDYLLSSATDLMALLAFPIKLSRTIIRGLAAEKARKQLAELTARGVIPPPASSYPPTLLNHPPVPVSHAVRMVVRADLRVPGYTVTVVALTAIAAALPDYLAARGAPPAALAAQVSIARTAATGRSRNNYRDAGIDLHADELDPVRRADLIAAALSAARVRGEHPLQDAPGRVTAVLPAPLLRRDIATFPLDQVPDTLTGHTVVSSVYRGPADLTCAGGRVRFTAGFPALGSVMHLTHGVHGLGDIVTLSLHADPAVMPDLDTYAAGLDRTLTEVVGALRGGV